MRRLSQFGLVLGIFTVGISPLAGQPLVPMAPREPGMMQEERGQGPMQPPAQPSPMRMMMGGNGSAMGPGMHEAVLRLMFILVDADGDGAFSSAELAAVQERIFNAADTDHDDRVTLEELTAFWHGSPAGP